MTQFRCFTRAVLDTALSRQFRWKAAAHDPGFGGSRWPLNLKSFCRKRKADPISSALKSTCPKRQALQVATPSPKPQSSGVSMPSTPNADPIVIPKPVNNKRKADSTPLALELMSAKRRHVKAEPATTGIPEGRRQRLFARLRAIDSAPQPLSPTDAPRDMLRNNSSELNDPIQSEAEPPNGPLFRNIGKRTGCIRTLPWIGTIKE